jgi:N-acetylneuraminic acid mutarotase
MAATLLERGALLVTLVSVAACGENASGADACATSGCAADLAWSTAPAVPGGGIQETAVVALDGKLYVLGGFNAAVEIVDTVSIFDTATETWSEGPALPHPMHHMNTAVVGGTIYVLGQLQGQNFVSAGEVFAWSPATDAAWSAKASMPAGSQRGAAVAGAIGDVIYVVGGIQTGLVDVDTLVSYSTTSDTWDTNLPPVPQPFDHGCGGVVGGKLYVIGGRYMGNTPLVFEYTPGGAWTQKASMLTARSGIACGIHGDQIVAAGGELNPANEASVFGDVEAYTVSTDTWIALPPLPTPRHGTGGAVWDGVFYVPGGATKTGFAAVDTHEALRL